MLKKGVKMTKIVILDGYTVNPGDLTWDKLRALGDVKIYDRTEEEKVVERIGDAPIVLTNKTIISESILSQCPQVRYIGVLATGYNVVDMDATNARGIIVTNIPTYGTEAVSQYTIALLLELCHHVGEHSRSVKNGEWAASEDFCYWKYPLIELMNKSIGIIGFGKIGRGVAKIAEAMGMKVLAYNRSPIESAYLNEKLQQVSLEELLSESDIISLHCPLNNETQGMINKDSIEQMKDGVLLINDSRGGLIVEEDLRQALIDGKIAGAAVDVASTEPIQTDNPLLHAPNIIITPHIAWASKESRERLLDIAVENVKAYMSGKAINIVK
jgi:glycerate dehydrogenase